MDESNQIIRDSDDISDTFDVNDSSIHRSDEIDECSTFDQDVSKDCRDRASASIDSQMLNSPSPSISSSLSPSSSPSSCFSYFSCDIPAGDDLQGSNQGYIQTHPECKSPSDKTCEFGIQIANTGALDDNIDNGDNDIFHSAPKYYSSSIGYMNNIATTNSDSTPKCRNSRITYDIDYTEANAVSSLESSDVATYEGHAKLLLNTSKISTVSVSRKRDNGAYNISTSKSFTNITCNMDGDNFKQSIKHATPTVYNSSRFQRCESDPTPFNSEDVYSAIMRPNMAFNGIQTQSKSQTTLNCFDFIESDIPCAHSQSYPTFHTEEKVCSEHTLEIVSPINHIEKDKDLNHKPYNYNNDPDVIIKNASHVNAATTIPDILNTATNDISDNDNGNHNDNNIMASTNINNDSDNHVNFNIFKRPRQFIANSRTKRRIIPISAFNNSINTNNNNIPSNAITATTTSTRYNINTDNSINYSNSQKKTANSNTPINSQRGYNRRNSTNKQFVPNYGSIESKVTRSEDSESKVERWPFLLINISLIFINCAGKFQSLVMDQFMYQHSAHTLLGNHSFQTSRHPCLNDTANSTQAELVQQVESLTSTRLLHLDMTSYGLGVITNLILGSYSTLLHRKVQLLIPSFGYLARHVTLVVVIFWKLDIVWLFIGYGLDGLCGNASGIYFGSYLYTTDITPRNRKRTLGVAILMTARGTVTGILNVVTGHLIESMGFFVPSVIGASCVLSSILIVMILPNRKPKLNKGQSQGQSDSSSCCSCSIACNRLTQPFRETSGDGGRVRTMVILGCLAFLGTMLSHFGIAKIRVLFLMNMPFCWEASVIGWFLFGREFACRTFVMVAVATLHKYFPGMTLGIIGVISYLGGMVMYIFANADYELYCVPAIAIGQSLPLALIRGELSRLLDAHLQGPLFACFAVLESVSYAVGSLYLLVFQASLNFFPRLVFVIGAGISVLVALCLVWLHVLWKRHMTSQLTMSVSINDNDDIK